MIGAVVVLYNPTKNEILNINSYKDLVKLVVIIDNSETNNKNIIQKFLSLDSKITYYTEKKNLGLCKGFNIGIKILKNAGCKWALLFDADSKLGNNIVDVYKISIEQYKNENIALFAPVHMFERSRNTPYIGHKEISWSMTSGWLLNIDVFFKQNGFFEELFVDGLDIDYCFKSHKNGYKIIECGEAVIIHNPAETKTTFFGLKYGIASPYRYYMQAKQLIWNTLYYKKPSMILIYFYKWFKVIFLFPNKKKYIGQMIKGTGEGVHIFKNRRHNI